MSAGDDRDPIVRGPHERPAPARYGAAIVAESPRLERLFARLPGPVRRAVYRARTRPGHHYSPYPSIADLRRREADVWADTAPAAIDLREAAQLELVERLASLGADLPWADEPVAGLRYHFGNRPYSHGDGVFLATMLRHLRPGRYVEVGSGHSTALALDVRDHFLAGELDIVTIDPAPGRLRAVLGDEAPPRFELIAQPVQAVDLGVFARLGPGDVLFIDSTHVARPGGDVNHLVFEVLPRLSQGVYVHVHDVFAGFEYPSDWVYGGRAWSEAYLIRAFLQFNDRFEVVLFTSWLQQRHPEWFAANLPRCGRNPGAQLWLRRVS